MAQLAALGAAFRERQRGYEQGRAEDAMLVTVIIRPIMV